MYRSKANNMDKPPRHGGVAAMENPPGGSTHDRNVNQHPLLVHLIMTNVLKYLEPMPIQDLRKFRQVCKVWNEVTLPEWRTRVAIKVGPPKPPLFRRIPILGAPSTSIDKFAVKKVAPDYEYMAVDAFIKMLESPPMITNSSSSGIAGRPIPFSGLILKRINFSQAPANRLWQAIAERRDFDDPRFGVGIAVDFIKLTNCIFPGNPSTVFYNVVTDHFDFLKKLSVCQTTLTPELMEEDEKYQMKPPTIPTNCSYAYLEIDGIEGVIPQNLFVAMIKSPQLETLILRNDFKHSCHNLRTFYNTRVPSIAHPSRIKHMDVMESLFFAGIQRNISPQLELMQMPLEHLSMTLEPFKAYGLNGESDNASDIRRVFMPLLKTHRNTLKVLKVFRPPVYRPSTQPLFLPANDANFVEPLEKLEEMHIWGNLFSEFSFLTMVPNLRVLYINPECADKTNELQQSFFPDDALRRLFLTRYLPYKQDLMKNTPMALRRQIHLDHMTSLHLDIMVTAGTVASLGSWMPNLKKFWSVLDKETFRQVGRSLPQLQVLGALLYSKVDDQTITGIEGDNNFNACNITVFKELDTFELQARCNSGLLTDQVAYNGFLKMKSLKTVNTCVSPKFSKTAENDLKMYIDNVNIIRNYDSPENGFEHSFGDCCRAWNLHQDLWGVW